MGGKEGASGSLLEQGMRSLPGDALIFRGEDYGSSESGELKGEVTQYLHRTWIQIRFVKSLRSSDNARPFPLPPDIFPKKIISNIQERTESFILHRPAPIPSRQESDRNAGSESHGQLDVEIRF